MINESTSSFEILRAYLLATASISEEEMDFIRTMFRPAALRSGEFLQRAGTVAKDSAFVAEKVPGYASGHRQGLQRRAAAQNERIVSAISASANDRYLRFLEIYPSLATRVPQWMVASYLGVTPETISRIRRKLARK